jgi:hypothetical protein
MRTKRGLVSFFLFFLGAVGTGGAWAQSSPFAGSWSGTTTDTSSATCTCSGPSCPAASTTVSCTFTSSWSGTVDAQGNFTVTFGGGTAVCDDGTNSPLDPLPPELFGQIPSNGVLSFPATSSSSGTSTFSCDAYSMQFSLSPPRVSSSSMCSGSSTASFMGNTTTCTHHSQETFTGTRSASGGALSTTPPVIKVSVTSNVTSTSANVSATIQPRPQDVGTNASIFVFAQAPSNLVIGTAQFDRAPVSPPIGARAEDAVVCVLAQVNANGQLVAVSASTMQAYLSGVLAAQSQSLTVLGNVPTPNVAGATLFVGYGGSAASMLSSGVFQTAISIPGPVQCTARLDSAPAPKSPGAMTGLWWNAAESGWGIHFTQRGTNTFAAWYTYDATGKPKWYVSTCAGASGTSGTCSGALFEVTGPAFFGASFNPSLVNAVNAGTLQATFRDANNASITYSVAGQTRTVALARQPLAAGTTPPAVDYSDLWWNPNESGWGMAMAQQYGITFLAWYVYDSNGKPTWLVATCTMSGSGCSGSLYRTSGPAFGPTFNPAQVQATAAGTVIVSFLDANNAVLSYTVDGVSATKSITRQLF